MSGAQWLFLLLGLLVVVPIVWTALGSYLSKRDFKRQVEGRRPERKAKKNMRLPDQPEEPNVSMDMSRLQFEAQMKQNKRGWH